jgi:DNA-binding transcriptional LysR family regulator
VEIKQLTALVTVAEVGSVTKAARLLRLVQPAVTRQIRLLEDEVGVPLFERTRQGMVPTEAGRQLVERARRALAELDRARAEIHPEPGEISGIVTVGVLESVMDLVATRLVEAVGARHPGIRLRLVTAYSGHLQQWLDDGEVDLSLLYNLTETPSLSVVPLLEERLWAVAPSKAGLQPRRPVRWSQVLRHPLVLPLPGHGLRVLVDQARSELEVQPEIAIETNSIHLQKQLVAAGLGWTVLPASGIAADVDAGLFSGAPLREPEVKRAVVIGLQRAGRPAPAVEAVAGELAGLARELVRARTWPSARMSVPR